MRRLLLLLLLAAAPLRAQTLAAQTLDAQTLDAQTLTVGVGTAVISVDPHYMDAAPNKGFASNIFDALTDMDATSRARPALALSWQAIDPTTWEFRLRPGVRFSDGHPFTADDVAFTLGRVGRVPGAPVPFTTYTRSIQRVEIVDPLTIRLHTAAPDPSLPVFLTQIKIIRAAAGESPAAEDFNAGAAAIGTGPFRLAVFLRGDRAELERNPLYWGEAPAWQHVSVRFIPNGAARVAALLSGDVQAIDTVPTPDIPRLRATPGLTLAETGSLRLIYLMMDQGRATTPYVHGPGGEALAANPLRDVRVRRALSLAINRGAIVDRVMEGAAIASGQFLPPGSVSYVPRLAPPPFEPERAKALLAEAGYPNGLQVTLMGPNDRYVNDAAILQAIGQMWRRAGVVTGVEPTPWASYSGRINRQDFSVALLGVGSATGDASVSLKTAVASYDPAAGNGTLNGGRYSSKALDDTLAQALATADDTAREALLQRATELAMDDVAIIPLHVQKNVWALRGGLGYQARTDEQTRCQDIRPTR